MSQQLVTLEVEKKAQKSDKNSLAERPTKDEVVIVSGSITVSF